VSDLCISCICWCAEISTTTASSRITSDNVQSPLVRFVADLWCCSQSQIRSENIICFRYRPALQLMESMNFVLVTDTRLGISTQLLQYVNYRPAIYSRCYINSTKQAAKTAKTSKVSSCVAKSVEKLAKRPAKKTAQQVRGKSSTSPRHFGLLQNF